MTPEQFAYWLQGYSELCGKEPTPEQWASIKEHLQLVFHKVTSPVPRLGYPPFLLEDVVTLCPPWVFSNEATC